MKTLELVGTVTDERTLRLTVQLPFDMPPGEHRVVVIIDQNPMDDNATQTTLDFPVDDYGPWPATLSLSREDLYDDTGR